MFEFKYQKALEFKEKEESDIIGLMSLKKRELDDANFALNKRIEELNEFMLEYQNKKNGKISINELLLYEEYSAVLKEKKQKQIQLIEKIEKECFEIQTLFFEKRKEVKIFKKLKEKALSEYIKEQDIKERKDIDEISNNLYNRRIQNGRRG